MKQVIVGQDLSGIGNISLATAIPILNVMQHKVFIFPMLYLSAQPKIAEGTVKVDFSGELAAIITHWASLKLTIDGLYLGYLGGSAQIVAAQQLIRLTGAQKGLILIDPVMGDQGQLYQNFSERYVEQMRTLIQGVDILTPNLTEICLLLDEPYREDLTAAQLFSLAQRVQAKWAIKQVVLTGITTATEIKVVTIGTDGERNLLTAPKLKGHFSGAGDIFASVLFGGLLKDETLVTATQTAVDFLTHALTETLVAGYHPSKGISFETCLTDLQKLN